MKTNCSCQTKYEKWEFEDELGCWYVIRECDVCSYYWEGPDYSKADISLSPHSNVKVEVNDRYETTEQSGKYWIYCFDKFGKYSSPRKLDDISDIFKFCELNKFSHHEIRVVDPTEDAIVILVKQEKYVYPEEWLRFNAP